MSEFRSVDAWAVVREDGSPHLIEKLGCSPKFMEVVLSSDPNAWAMHEFYAKKDDGKRVVPVTISPRAAWVKVSERLPPIGKLVIVFDESDTDPETRFDCSRIVDWNPWNKTLYWSRGEDGGYADLSHWTHWTELPQAPKEK